MKVLSLFDGISCGQVALNSLGIHNYTYYASEVDKNAIAITQKNFPNTIQLGDVNNIDFSLFQDIDLLIGGSPCQSLSITRAEIRQNLDGKSKLFYKYAEAKDKIKPKWFLFENVASMNQESKDIITSSLGGGNSILLNSNCFVPQDRSRLYWTNIPLEEMPTECDLCLKDIMLDNVPEKYYYKQEPTKIDMNKQVCAYIELNINQMHKRVFNPNFKVHTLTAVCGGNHQKKVLVNGRIRKLTPLEYERLQELPDGYTDGFSDSVRYKVIGNGWTVPAISWLLKGLL